MSSTLQAWHHKHSLWRMGGPDGKMGSPVGMPATPRGSPVPDHWLYGIINVTGSALLPKTLELAQHHCVDTMSLALIDWTLFCKKDRLSKYSLFAEQCSVSDSQPLCHDPLVCHERSVGVLQELGGGSFISRATKWVWGRAEPVSFFNPLLFGLGVLYYLLFLYLNILFEWQNIFFKNW